MGNVKQIHTMAGVPMVGEVGSSVGQAMKKSIIPGIIGGLGTAFLGPVGPILGSLASAGLNFGLNRIETGIQNRYNSPHNTMQRLEKAGLPGAAYFNGGGNRSASSSQQYTQPDLGTAESISREQVNRYQKQQFELMKREMSLKEAQQRLAEANAYKSEIWGDYFGRDSTSPQLLSNFGAMIESGNRLRKAQTFLTANKGAFQQIENNIERQIAPIKVQMAKANLDVTKQKIPLMKVQEAVGNQQIQESISRIAKNMVSMDAMKKQMSVADQTIAIRGLEEKLNQIIVDEVSNQGTGYSAMKSAVLKLLLGGHFKPF